MTKQLNVKIIKSPDIKIKIDGAKGLDGTGSVSFVNTGNGIGVYTSTINNTIGLKSIKSVSQAISVTLESGAIGIGIDQTKLNLQKSQIINLVSDLDTINSQIAILNSFKTSQTTLNATTTNQINSINSSITTINTTLSSIQDNLNLNNSNISYLYNELTTHVTPLLNSLVSSVNALNSLLVGSNKGDLIVYNGSNYIALPLGSNGQVLTVDNTTLSGLSYKTPNQTTAPVTSVAGKIGVVTLNKNDVGLGNIDNTSDVNKPISTATQNALDNKVDKVSGKGLSTEDYTTTEKNKLAGLKPIKAGSNITFDTTTDPSSITINSTSSGGGSGDMSKSVYDTNNNGVVDNSEALNGQNGNYYLNRDNHTGTQTASTISDFSNAFDTRFNTKKLDDISDVNLTGITNGQSIKYDSSSQTFIPYTPNSGGGSAPVTSVAGKTGDVTLTKNDVGLNNVDNTSDVNKPISTATQNALDNKVDKISGKGLSTEDYTTSEKNKLASLKPIQAGTNISFDTTTDPSKIIINSTSSGGSGLTYFTESNNTTGTNASYPANALKVVGTGDIDAVFSPGGNGGFMLNIPDGTTTGGNKRGYYSVDLQLRRGDASRVAYGQYGFIGSGYNNGIYGAFSGIVNGVGNVINNNYGFIGSGNNNIINGDYNAILGGANNTTSNPYSSALGGSGNQATGSNSLVGGGSQNIANSNSSVVLGGMYNQMVSDCSYGSIIGGYQNTMNNSAYGSVMLGGYNNYINVTGNANIVTIVGGQNNQAAGQYSIILAGQYNKVNAEGCVISGKNAYNKSIKNANVFSSGNFLGYNGDGAAQRLELILRGKTNTDNSPYTLISDYPANNSANNSNQLTIMNNEIKHVEGYALICDSSNVSNYIKYNIDVTFCKYNSVVTILNNSSYSPDGTINNLSLDIVADNVNSALSFNISKSGVSQATAIARIVSIELIP